MFIYSGKSKDHSVAHTIQWCIVLSSMNEVRYPVILVKATGQFFFSYRPKSSHF
jgi:hypothetical protein